MKLKDYWILQIQETTEFKQIADTEQPEVDTLYQEIDHLPNEIIVNTATHEGLKKYEKVLDLQPFSDMETRRFNILLKLNNNVNMTYRWLENKLKNAVGEGSYQIDLNPSNYTIRISVTSDKENILISLKRELRRLIPANLGLDTSSLDSTECGVFTGVLVRTFDYIEIGG